MEQARNEKSVEKDSKRTKKKEAKKIKKFKTSTQKGRYLQKKINLCSAHLRKPGRWGQPSMWAGRRCSGHQWKNGSDQMTKTYGKSVVLFVEEKGTLKRNAPSLKALQAAFPVNIWLREKPQRRGPNMNHEGRKTQHSKWPLRRSHPLGKLGSFHRTQQHRSGFNWTLREMSDFFFNLMKLLMREKNFNTVLSTINPHRFKDFNRKPWCMYLIQVKRNVTMGQYSMNTVSWFLILSKHTKNVCWETPSKWTPFSL